MRLRNIPGSEERIISNKYSYQTDNENCDNFSGLWNKKYFKNNNPIHIEIGMGKGKFITALAEKHPEINYIGIEKYSSVLVRALDKQDTLNLTNLLFLRLDAEDITSFFSEGEIEKIYLNFSDPWPKDRHAKRRLTSENFLAKYDKILCKSGVVEFKTDNKKLFDFSLSEARSAGWDVKYHTYNLHAQIPAADNIMTEYEEKFYKMGYPICKLVMCR